MSLLRDIQKAAIDSTVELGMILRMCKVLAVRLGHEDFKNWVDQELNGYVSKDHLPSYRMLRAHSKGTFAGYFGKLLQNLPIPPSTIPEQYREYIETAHLPESVSAYEALIKQASQGTVRIPWPADLVLVVSSEIYTDMNCIEAWIEIPVGALVGLLNTVRNRILNFVLEIELEAPMAGEAHSGEKPLPHDRVSQFFTTYIQGGPHNVAIGASSVSQDIHQQVVPHDVSVPFAPLEAGSTEVARYLGLPARCNRISAV